MTFSEFLLEGRQYLHDIRKIDGTLITTATEDGIRWTSSLLVSIGRDALIEMARTLLASKLENNFAYDVNTRIVNCKIVPDNTYGVLELLDGETYDFYSILGVQVGVSKEIYDPIKDKAEFFDKAWRTGDVSSAGSISHKCFTVVYDQAAKKQKVLVLPNPATEITGCKAVVQYSLEASFILVSTDQLPFVNSVDLAFDFLRKTAYLKEHNIQQAQAATEVINAKIALMKAGK